MPILKPISGHTGCAPIKRYLEREGRALAIDCLNFYWCEDEKITSGELMPEGFDWAFQMDRTRQLCGNDKAHGSRKARTYKHYVISPDPKDQITLDELCELAGTWLIRHFPNHEAVIIYHDDNERRIPHAHVVVNNTDLKTGNRLRVPSPKALNRDLQEIAKEIGLHAFDNEEHRVARCKERQTSKPRTRKGVRRSRAELRIREEGGYSWVADIRDRVDIAKRISSDEAEFKEKLLALGVTVDDGKSRRHRPDWVYGLADQPTRRVCGETLGVLYGKSEIISYFLRLKEVPTKPEVRRKLLESAKRAVTLNDLEELHELATAITLCRDYRVASIEGLDAKIERLRKIAESTHGSLHNVRLREVESLIKARDFMADHELLPQKAPRVAGQPKRREPSRRGRTYPPQPENEGCYEASYIHPRSYERSAHRDIGRDR